MCVPRRRSLCPIGREAQVLIPDKSLMDNKLLSTFKEKGRKEFGEVMEVDTGGLLPMRCVVFVFCSVAAVHQLCGSLSESLFSLFRSKRPKS